jgi:hypothetical protein
MNHLKINTSECLDESAVELADLLDQGLAQFGVETSVTFDESGKLIEIELVGMPPTAAPATPQPSAD